MALSPAAGMVTLKLYGAPGCDMLNCCGALTGPARTKRCWKNPGTVGLPDEAVPRAAVAAAVKSLPVVNTTAGGELYPVPGVVTLTEVIPQRILKVAFIPLPEFVR